MGTIKLEKIFYFNEGISAASFCRQVPALVADMFRKFYLVKNPKIANNSATTEAREKIRPHLKSLEFLQFFDVRLTNYKNYQILLHKISHRFLLTIQLFSGWKSLIDANLKDWWCTSWPWWVRACLHIRIKWPVDTT